MSILFLKGKNISNIDSLFSLSLTHIENEFLILALVPDENQTNVSKLPAHDNELFIREDNDSLKAETNVQGNSMLVEQEKKTHLTNEEHDEEFERDFLRAVDRALGVVNKDGNNFLQTNEDLPTTKSTDESTLNLQQITEQALSSFQSSPLFQVRDD